ncbi:hypothetical protein D9C73_004199 [Collichthys lucidus]|uniref:Uncharacterized protein n=1 Tax=Collichthys lucidus TaxID=240159 RepID=A0A4V6AMV2_COLLU|nr:hypothetical protein D9C73_004199 [Collichthys lucidus]
MKTTAARGTDQTSAPAVKKSKAVRRTEEGLRSRKEGDRLRVKTRINISYCFKRWRQLKEDMHLRTDGDVANYLLNLSFSELSARTTNTFGTLQTFTRYTETCSQNISVFLKLKRVKSPSRQLKQCGVERFQCGQRVAEGLSINLSMYNLLKIHSSYLMFSWLFLSLQSPELANDHCFTQGPSTSSQASSVTVHVTDVETATLSSSLPTPVDSGAQSTSSMSPPSAEVSESLSSVASEDRLSERFHQETELNSTATSNLDKNTEKDLSQSKTIVNDSCLMELFKKCQTCGQPITKKQVSHCGAQKKVRWSCLGGHRGLWMSSPHLWEAFPEIHLLMALSVLFSGGAFTHFEKWAKHLQLNFMEHKTFFEIQKAYLDPEMKQMNRTEQEKIFEKGVCQVPEGTLHISDHSPTTAVQDEDIILHYITEPETEIEVIFFFLFLLSRSSEEKKDRVKEKRQGSYIVTVKCVCKSLLHYQVLGMYQPLKAYLLSNRCDLDSDMENVVETTELSAPGADDSSDDEIYVPIIPQRSTASELFLECEEEELEPWQKQISHVRVKKEKDDVEFIAQQQLFQKMVTPKVKEEAYDPISNLVSLSSVQSPVVYAPSSNQLPSDQSNS